jgi:hypothetical protein
MKDETQSITHYLNTDLDLASAEDLSSLAQALQDGGMLYSLHVTQVPSGGWTARFETYRSDQQPQATIEAMLDVIEKLPKEAMARWRKCTQREFNIGYDCGREPWAFTQGLSSTLLGRMAALEISLGVTLYPCW